MSDNRILEILKGSINSDKVLEIIDKNIIQNSHFYTYSKFYEQIYLYVHLCKLEDYECPRFNISFNIKDYNHIYNYIFLFKESFKIILIDHDMRSDFEFTDDDSEQNLESLKVKQNKFRGDLIEEWEVYSLGLTKENFYDKCQKNLDELNDFVKKECSRLLIINGHEVKK